MKRVLVLSFVGAFVLTMSGLDLAWGKAHIPLDMVQVCQDGESKVIRAKKLQIRLNHGDCQLPACDFNNIFAMPSPNGADCSAVDAPDENGQCMVLNPRNPANGITPACTPF